VVRGCATFDQFKTHNLTYYLEQFLLIPPVDGHFFLLISGWDDSWAAILMAHPFQTSGLLVLTESSASCCLY
jgi:hypothetical protein